MKHRLDFFGDGIKCFELKDPELNERIRPIEKATVAPHPSTRHCWEPLLLLMVTFYFTDSFNEMSGQ